MKVCVVGGSGNIGTSMVRLLVDQGHEVTCFSRGQTGRMPAPVRHLRGDRRQRDAFEATMRKDRYDAVVDMVCFDEPDVASGVRAFGGTGHVVMCSTAAVYGVDFDWLPVTEHHPLRPVSDYGRSKRDAEVAARSAYQAAGIPLTIIRPGCIYGNRRVMLRQVPLKDPRWVDRVRKGKPIVMCGDGNAIMQFLHVDDAAPAFVHVLARDRCCGETYNLANPAFTTWGDYHRAAMKVIGREVDLVGVPFADLERARVPNFRTVAEMTRHHLYLSCEKLMSHVPEFRPRVLLEAGLGPELEKMDREGLVEDSDAEHWEDEVIAAQRRVAQLLVS